MKFPAQMSLVEEKKKKWSRAKKKVLEQHSIGYSTGRVEAFLMLNTLYEFADLPPAEAD